MNSRIIKRILWQNKGRYDFLGRSYRSAIGLQFHTVAVPEPYPMFIPPGTAIPNHTDIWPVWQSANGTIIQFHSEQSNFEPPTKDVQPLHVRSTWQEDENHPSGGYHHWQWWTVREWASVEDAIYSKWEDTPLRYLGEQWRESLDTWLAQSAWIDRWFYRQHEMTDLVPPVYLRLLYEADRYSKSPDVGVVDDLVRISWAVNVHDGSYRDFSTALSRTVKAFKKAGLWIKVR